MCMVNFTRFYINTCSFLTANLDTIIPFNIDDCEDVDYQQKRDSAQELTEYWRKSQIIKLILETVEITNFKAAKIGEIILVKMIMYRQDVEIGSNQRIYFK